MKKEESESSNFLTQESELKKLREELYCFLNRKVVNDSVNANRTAVYRMISTHVDFETQLHIANKLKGLFEINYLRNLKMLYFFYKLMKLQDIFCNFCVF